MRGNRIRSFVTRNGQVIRVRANRVRREPSNARTGARGPGTQHQRPAGPAAAGGGMDLPRLGALILLAFACLLVVMLMAVGTYRAGKWAFSGRGGSPSDVRVESGRRDTRTIAPQKSVSLGPSSASDSGGEVGEESHDAPIDQQAHARGEMVTYGRQPGREREVAPPIVSSEPVVDYVSSVREMESAVEARSKEIKRIIEDLRNIRRSDENDW